MDMSIQFLTYNSRVALRPTVCIKIKRRLRETVNLIVTRGAAVEESRKGSKLVFRAEDVGAEKWIAPGMLLSHAPPIFLLLLFSLWWVGVECVLVAHDELHVDWTYAALPTTEMFRMPFADLIGLMRQALWFLHQRIPEVERTLRSSGRQDGDATLLVRSKSNSHHASTEGSTSRVKGLGRLGLSLNKRLRGF